MSQPTIENATPTSDWLLALINGLQGAPDAVTFMNVTASPANLPAATGSNASLAVKNNTGGNLTVTPDGGDTIDGVAGAQTTFYTHTLRDGSALLLFDYGAGTWAIIGALFT